MSSDRADVNTEQLIEEIRCRTGIWDVSSQDYKDRNIKKNLWIEICLIFFPDFEEYEAKNKLNICKQLQDKWKHIRDGYVRSLKIQKTKSGQARRKTKTYLFAEHLQFLKNIQPRSTESSVEEILPDNNSETHNIDEDERNNEGSEKDGEETGEQNEEILPDNNSETHNIDEDERNNEGSEKDGEETGEQNGFNEATPNHTSTNATTTAHTRKRKRLEEKLETYYIDNYQQPKPPTKEENSDDMQFFRSLLPILTPLSMFQKLKVRMAIMNLLLPYTVSQNILTLNPSDAFVQPTPQFSRHDSHKIYLR
ncbi:Alcohol dehydrogenase transcription factor Myb/SANT-like [Popillia japonica]|uniref:Alcohol dehydrogenase transcription factor Myb/SANT-like n=1 Tax=Popillia japonica TaxID=7064 RepID=A0AAW1IY30_POPJA